MKPNNVNIIEVSYGITVNIGNYESIRVDLKARVDPNQPWQDVYENLKKKCLVLKTEILKENTL